MENQKRGRGSLSNYGNKPFQGEMGYIFEMITAGTGKDFSLQIFLGGTISIDNHCSHPAPLSPPQPLDIISNYSLNVFNVNTSLNHTMVG